MKLDLNEMRRIAGLSLKEQNSEQFFSFDVLISMLQRLTPEQRQHRAMVFAKGDAMDVTGVTTISDPELGDQPVPVITAWDE